MPLKTDTGTRPSGNINDPDERLEHFNLDNLDPETFASKTVIKSTSKPYVKVAKSSNRDLSSSKVEQKSPVSNPRKEPSRSKLTSSSKINLY